MNIPAEFDEIRPYAPEELPQVFEELIADPMFKAVVGQVMPGIPFDMLAAQMRQCKTNLDFQKAFFYRLLKELVQKCAKGLEFDCSAITDKTINYTFISNHRDIVLDSALLSVVLMDQEDCPHQQVVHREAWFGFARTIEVFDADVQLHALCHHTEA